MPNIDVNGQTIDYPDTGDPNWGDNATNFAIQTSAALGKIGLSSGTSVDITQTLDVTGNTTLDANLSVGGNTTLTGNLTINSNGLNIPNGLNIDTNTLVIDATNDRVGVGTNNPGSKLDVFGSNGITNFTGTSRLGILVRGSTSSNDYSGIDFTGSAGIHPQGRIALLSTGSGSELSFGTSNNYASGITNESLKISFNGQLSAIVPGGSTLYPGYLCRAWVNFNGTGAVSIRASGNVTSITDNGEGNYTVNFTTAMPDVNYSLSTSTGINVSVGQVVAIGTRQNGSFQIISYDNTGNLKDSDYIGVSIFR